MCSQIEGENYSILDFGCGEALYAEGISKKCAELVVMDTSCKVRKLLMDRTRGVENITITNSSDLLKFEDEKFDSSKLFIPEILNTPYQHTSNGSFNSKGKIYCRLN